jgi:uncharacterized protein (TIGR04141 family)
MPSHRSCPETSSRDVKTRLHRTGGLEIGDLLGPENQLVMVKQASKADKLSHLFFQALVAVQALKDDPVRAAFIKAVQEISGGKRELSDDFKPNTIVFAILLKNGQQLTSDTLFPFAQIALLDTITTLRAEQINVEIVGIDAEPATGWASAA